MRGSLEHQIKFPPVEMPHPRHADAIKQGALTLPSFGIAAGAGAGVFAAINGAVTSWSSLTGVLLVVPATAVAVTGTAVAAGVASYLVLKYGVPRLASACKVAARPFDKFYDEKLRELNTKMRGCQISLAESDALLNSRANDRADHKAVRFCLNERAADLLSAKFPPDQRGSLTPEQLARIRDVTYEVISNAAIGIARDIKAYGARPADGRSIVESNIVTDPALELRVRHALSVLGKRLDAMITTRPAPMRGDIFTNFYEDLARRAEPIVALVAEKYENLEQIEQKSDRDWEKFKPGLKTFAGFVKEAVDLLPGQRERDALVREASAAVSALVRQSERQLAAMPAYVRREGDPVPDITFMQDLVPKLLQTAGELYLRYNPAIQAMAASASPERAAAESAVIRLCKFILPREKRSQLVLEETANVLEQLDAIERDFNARRDIALLDPARAGRLDRVQASFDSRLKRAFNSIGERAGGLAETLAEQPADELRTRAREIDSFLERLRYHVTAVRTRADMAIEVLTR